MKFILVTFGLVALAALAHCQETRDVDEAESAQTREARMPAVYLNGLGNGIDGTGAAGLGNGNGAGFGGNGAGFGGNGAGFGGAGLGNGVGAGAGNGNGLGSGLATGAGLGNGAGNGFAGYAGNGFFVNHASASLRACRFVDTLAALRTRAVQPLDDARRAVLSLERYLDTISRVMNQIAIRNQCNIRVNHYSSGHATVVNTV